MSQLLPRIAAVLLAGGLLGAVVVPAGAADLDGDWGGPPAPGYEHRPPPPPPPAWEPPPPRFTAAPPPPPSCRVILRRHFDPYGDEVIRRVRVCDGPPDGFGPPPWRRPGW